MRAQFFAIGASEMGVPAGRLLARGGSFKPDGETDFLAFRHHRYKGCLAPGIVILS